MLRSFPSHSSHRRWKIAFYNPLINPLVSLLPEASSSNFTSTTKGISSTKPPQHAAESDGKLPELAYPMARMPPEWLDFMEVLLKRGYFEDSVTMSSLSSATNDSNSIRTACLNYARERAGLLQTLPKIEVKVIARYGCPSIDRKVVSSGKRLRAYAGISEANACGSCNLRGICERAYANAREDEPGRTVDLIRILFFFLFGSKDGTFLSDRPMLEQSARRLLKEIVHHDGKLPYIDRRTAAKSQPLKQGDWICLQCSYHNFAKNVRCLRCNELSNEKLMELKREFEQFPLKKGDWICETCNFFNFARNTKCFICSERPANRKINPGEWECDSCHYINFKRNVKCLNCDYNRAKRWSVETAIGVSGKSQPKKSNGWSFVEDKSKSTKDEVDFPDFPVCGGVSSLSENMQKKEKLRRKMTKPRPPSDEELKKLEYERKMNYVQCSDGEELADWFGS